MVRRTRRHTGGDTGFGYKYTRDEPRLKWVDALSPYALTIASILPKIAWDGFRYEGPLQVETDAPYNSTRKGFSVNAQQSRIVHTTRCRSVDPLEYQVFGGGACELWGVAIPEVPIRKYVDFTGDLDVRVRRPDFTIDDPEFIAALERDGVESDPMYMDPILLDERGFTPYGEAITHWLYDEVVARVREISPYFNKRGFVVPDYREDHETAISDLQTVIGNLLVCRSPMLDRNMIKIQVTAKVATDSVPEMNHIMEFILMPSGNFNSFSVRNNTFRVNGIYLQQPRTLLQDQVRGMTGRATGILNTISSHPEVTRVEDYPSFYKFDNHCARVLYLAHLQKAIEGKRIGGSSKPADYLTKTDALRLLEEIYAASADKMCYKHFGDNYIDQLIAVLETMQYVQAGQLTTKLNARTRADLNRAKAKGRAVVGGRRRTRTGKRR